MLDAEPPFDLWLKQTIAAGLTIPGGLLGIALTAPATAGWVAIALLGFGIGLIVWAGFRGPRALTDRTRAFGIVGIVQIILGLIAGSVWLQNRHTSMQEVAYRQARQPNEEVDRNKQAPLVPATVDAAIVPCSQQGSVRLPQDATFFVGHVSEANSLVDQNYELSTERFLNDKLRREQLENQTNGIRIDAILNEIAYDSNPSIGGIQIAGHATVKFILNINNTPVQLTQSCTAHGSSHNEASLNALHEAVSTAVERFKNSRVAN